MCAIGWRARTNAINTWFEKRAKYRNRDYEDEEIEGMMKYFKVSSYGDLLILLKHMQKD
ncbi:hypothetical protein [Candidatus Nitrososphaera sp. FF02]|uniref:hypothetical protein n=1 Tax=Candidatus Nitrososphaera sp. FF02 TaxID=3398226 RepID=UPI0039EB29C8